MNIPSSVNSLLIVVLLLGELFLFVAVQRLNRSLHSLFGKKDNKDVFEVLLRQEEKSKELAKELQRLTRGCEFTAEVASQSMQKVGIVRFNPFHTTGGDQSFCLAVLDRGNNGFVITSLHSSDTTRMYTKAIKNGGSEQQLSREEEKAVMMAIENKNNK